MNTETKLNMKTKYKNEIDALLANIRQLWYTLNNFVVLKSWQSIDKEIYHGNNR